MPSVTDPNAAMIQRLAAWERECPRCAGVGWYCHVAPDAAPDDFNAHTEMVCVDCKGAKVVPVLPVLRRACGFRTSPRDSSHPTDCFHCHGLGWVVDYSADTGDVMDALREAGYIVQVNAWKLKSVRAYLWSKSPNRIYSGVSETTREALLLGAVAAMEAGDG